MCVPCAHVIENDGAAKIKRLGEPASIIEDGLLKNVRRRQG
ncbi:MAG: hypothetical protein ACYYK0_07725 [Candidatus Eutrophobiaceae bacterium]